MTGTTDKKRGYVPATSVTLTESAPDFSSLTSNSGIRYVNTSASTYTGPASSGYATAGSLTRGESVSYLGYKTNSYAFVEYDVTGTSQKKRAYFYENYLSTSPVTSDDKYFKDAITPLEYFTQSDHHDYPVVTGTPVYAMCDGTFEFAYWYGRQTSSSALSFISLGIGGNLTPDTGWSAKDGRTASKIQYGHMDSLVGYTIPTNYERNSFPSSYDDCYEHHKTVLGTRAVVCGELIGYSDDTGNSKGAHLHIELV